MMDLFNKFLNDLYRMSDERGRNVISAVLEGYMATNNAIMESGPKFVTDDGQVFIIDPPWSNDEDEILINGGRPQGRSRMACNKRRQILRKHGKLPPLPTPGRAITVPDIDKYELTREPPEWVMEKYGNDRTRAKKYCDDALRRRRAKLRTDCPEQGPVRRTLITREQVMELLDNGKIDSKNSSQCRHAKQNINRFIEKHPELNGMNNEQIADEYMKMIDMLGGNRWGDYCIDGPNIIIPSTDSMLAMEGEVPDSHSVCDTRARRNLGRRQTAIRGIRADVSNSDYVPTINEINKYTDEHKLRNEDYHTRMPTAKSLSEYFTDRSPVTPFNMGKDRISEIKNQMAMQGIDPTVDGRTFRYAGKRRNEYRKRDEQ